MAAEFRLTFTGTDALIRALRAAGVGAPRAAARALTEEGERIMAEAKGQTPVDTGALRASGHVRPPEMSSGGQVSVELVFGGAAAPYALYVHEDLSARHVVGTAKFLERPMLAASRGVADRLAHAIRRGARGV